MIEEEVKQVLFEYLLTDKDHLLLGYFRQSPDDINEPMNQAGKTVLDMAQQFGKDNLFEQLNQILTCHELNIEDDSDEDSVDSDDSDQPYENLDMLRSVHSLYNSVFNPQDKSTSQNSINSNEDTNKLQKIVDNFTATQLAQIHKQNRPSDTRKKVYNAIEKLILGRLSENEIIADSVLDYILTVKSLVHIYNLVADQKLDEKLQDFFNLRDLKIRGTRLDYCFASSLINTVLTELAGDNPHNVLMQNSLETLPGVDGAVETFRDLISGDPVSLSDNPRQFVRDQEGYIHSVHHYDEDYQRYQGLFAKGIEKLTPSTREEKAAIRKSNELWFVEDPRLGHTKLLPSTLQNWFVDNYDSFKELHEYVKQFEAYDKNNEAKVQFNALIEGLYAGGKKQGSGTEENAGEESTIAVANFTGWLNGFKEDCPNQYRRLMNATAYISNGKAGTLEKLEEKSLEEILFPILYPTQALKKDAFLLCSDQNGSNLKAFLEKQHIQSLFNGLNLSAVEPTTRSKYSLETLHGRMNYELKTKKILEVDQHILPAGYDGISIDAIQQLEEMTINEFHFIVSVLSQPGLAKIKGDFLSGKDKDSWQSALKVYKSEPVYLKEYLNFHQLQTHLMATYLQAPQARLDPYLVSRSIQQAMDESSNETPWISQLLKISKQIDGRFSFNDQRLPMLKAGEFLVHKTGGHKTQYKLVDRVRNISIDAPQNSGKPISAREVECEATDILRLRNPYNLKARRTDRVDINGDYVYEYPTSYDDEIIEDEIEAITDRYWWNEMATAWQQKCINSCKSCYTCREVVSNTEYNGEWRDRYGNLIARKIKQTKKNFKEDVFFSLHEHWQELSIGKEGQTEIPLTANIVRNASLVDYAIVTTNVDLFRQLVELGMPVNLRKLFNNSNQVMSRYMMQQIIKVLIQNKVKSLSIEELRHLFSECRRLNQPLLLSDIIELGLPVNDRAVNLRKDPKQIYRVDAQSYTSILDFALQTQNKSLISACINSYKMSTGNITTSISQLCDLYKRHPEIRVNHKEIIAKKMVDGLLRSSAYISNYTFQGVMNLSDALLGQLAKQASKEQLVQMSDNLIETFMLQSFLCRKLENTVAVFEKRQSVKPVLLRLLSTNQISGFQCSSLLKEIFSKPLLKNELLEMLCLPSSNPQALKLVSNRGAIIKLLNAISKFPKNEIDALSEKQIYTFLKLSVEVDSRALQINLESAFFSKIKDLEQASKDLLLKEVMKKGVVESVQTYFNNSARLANVDDIRISSTACRNAISYYLDLLKSNKGTMPTNVLLPLSQQAFERSDDGLLSKLINFGLSVTHQFNSPFARSTQLIDLAINNQKNKLLTTVVSKLEQVKGHNLAAQDTQYVPRLRETLLRAYLNGVAQGSKPLRKIDPSLLKTALQSAINTNNVADINFLIKQGANATECISQLTLKNAQLLPELLAQDQKACAELKSKFIAMYDAMYRTNAFINVCPFSFFRSAHRWQDKKPTLMDVVNYCKENPNSRSAKVFVTLLNHSQMLTSVEEVQDKTNLFQDLHKLSHNSSIFSSTHTDDATMQNEKSISDFIQQHQGSRSDVIAQAIGIK